MANDYVSEIAVGEGTTPVPIRDMEALHSGDEAVVYVGDILDLVYPIGSIYMSVSPTDPSNIFGGAWFLWGAGRVPICVDEHNTALKDPELTGGEEYHTLLVDELPQHDHGYTKAVASNTSTRLRYAPGSSDSDSLAPYPAISSRSERTSGAGSGDPFSIMPPYITCYMWKRVA